MDARWQDKLTGSSVTLNFDLLTPKLEAFIFVSKCTKAESLVKISPILFQDIVSTMFGTHGRTLEQPENIMPPAIHCVCGGIKIINNIIETETG